MTNFPLEHDCVAKQEQDELMMSIPECLESCELKQQFLETPKEEFNSAQIITEFVPNEEAGDKTEIEEFFVKDNLNILLEENRLEILSLEREIAKMKAALSDGNNRLKKLKERFLELIPFDTEYIKEIINGNSEEE